ncbi:hypothetical protein ACQJBY_057066 [Aegilops geniculata]
MGGSISSVSTMGPAILFLLGLAAIAPSLLLAAQTLGGYSMAKPSTIWINNDVFFESRNRYSRDIVAIAQSQAHSGIASYIAAGFFCVSSSMFPCKEFLFAVSIVAPIDTVSSIHNSQIVWSANQACPVGENATLEFTSGGNLVLCDADGSYVWSSNSSDRSVARMVLTKFGNLVLLNHMNAIVWQSFDHPTDTLVLGQSLAKGMRLIANTSATNTIERENQLYITVLPDGLYAYVGSTPPQLYFSYIYSSLVDHMEENDLQKVTFMNGNLSMSNMNDSISLPAAKSTQYLRLDSDGHMRLYEYELYDEKWTVVHDVMRINDCAYPTVCGEYGICTRGQCGCPVDNNSSSRYFKLLDEWKPNLGCAPITPISCQEIEHHQLLTIPNISYFDQNPTVVNATSVDDCKQACLKNCSCMAVLFREGECVWVTKVFSLQSIQPTNFLYNSSAYLKVQLSPSRENKMKALLSATLGAITALILIFIIVTLYLQRRKHEDKDEEFDFSQLPGMPTRFSLETLSECTEGFNKKLGEGGFGSVFEGKLGEIRVAVKRLEGARQGKKEFLAEVETIGNIEHINLVNLIGFCVEKSERLLVYEYMSRGSLDRWIFYSHNNAPLDWSTRCRIIMDIAKGLCYLHEQCRRKIAHLDIKPQNILLDENFNAKVADFGLCKLINRDQSKVVTVMRGTPGYLAPEWLTSRITEKVDVYSFGVVIMEIVSGRKNVDNSQPEEDVQLINLLREKAQNEQLIDLIDKHSGDMVSYQEEVVQMMKLAIWCLQHDSIQRPSMSLVIKVLEGTISIETFDADSLLFVQDNPSTYSIPSQASILSGPR